MIAVHPRCPFVASNAAPPAPSRRQTEPARTSKRCSTKDATRRPAVHYCEGVDPADWPESRRNRSVNVAEDQPGSLDVSHREMLTRANMAHLN